MAVVWTSNAFPGAEDYRYWDGPQEIAGDRIQIVAPPAEVGGGPQSRSYMLRSRINAGDSEPFGNPAAQRAEIVADVPLIESKACQGQEMWFAWEAYFGNPSTVSDDANAFRASAGTDWNAFTQFHQNAGATTQPVSWGVNARSGSDPSGWRFFCWTRGGDEANPTGIEKHDMGAFTYGWHEFKAYIRWEQATGRMKVWLDDVLVVDYTGPVGFSPDSTGGNCNYLKQGCYRSKSAVDSTVFIAGSRMGTTEADVGGSGGSGGGGGVSPDANTRDRRFGKATVGSSRNGFSQNMKSGSKFATGLGVSEEADVKDLHVFVEGMDGSASTQKLTVGVYADDGTGGLPSTKFGECDVEIEKAGTAAGQWVKVTPSSAIRVTGANAWLIVVAGSPTNRLAYATDTVTGGLVYAADTYDVSAPRLASPFGAGSLENIQMSVCADYDVVSGSSGGGGDTTPPALASATVNADVVELAYDEPLNAGSTPQTGDYAVIVNGSSRAKASVTVAGSDVQIVLSQPVSAGDTVTVTYTRATGREVKDTAGNLAANLTGQTVTNQTSAEVSSGRLVNMARATTIARTVNPSARVAGGSGGGI